jgi:hypothetical protein
VEDPDETAGDAAHRVVVAGVSCAEFIAEGAGSGGCGERGQGLGVQGVDEVPVADVAGVHRLLLAGLDRQRGGAGVVLAGLGAGVAAGGVAELADLSRERAVLGWLVAAGHQPSHSYVPNSDTVRGSCLEDVDNCDLYVLIVGVPASRGQS